MRKADVLTQWSKKRLAALLAFTDARGAATVEERIRKNLGSALASHCRFTSLILPGKDEVIRELVDDTPAEAAN